MYHTGRYSIIVITKTIHYMIKISVIIPTFKPQPYVWECLDSLAKQTLQKESFEIIVVLNGCDEPYNSHLKEYMLQHNDIQWVYRHIDTPGVSNARNTALKIARGEYITFIDDDDFVSPHYLEELLAKASPETVSLCYPLSFIDGTDNYVPYYITKDYITYCGKDNIPFYIPRRFFAGPVYKLIHRNIIGNRLFDLRFKNGEDSLFMFLISNKINSVRFTSRNAIYYRRERINSASNNGINLSYTIVNSIKLINAYSCIYFKNVSSYSLRFYITIVFSAIKKIAFDSLKKIKG